MGLIDKLKNLFTDEEEIEEYDEIEKEEVVPKKEKKRTLPTFMRQKLEKEEKEDKDDIIESLTREDIHQNDVIEEVKKKEEEPQFKFPFVFDESDFVEPVLKEEVKEKIKEEVKKENNLYNASKKEKEKETKKFRPTPIISPVYGILDKNYKKEEVKSKPEHRQKLTRASSKKTDFESVRKKAYGTLSDEISDNLLQEVDNKNVEVIDSDNLLYEITTDKDTTIANAEENYYDFGVSYEVPKRESKNKDSEVKIVNHNEDTEVKADKIEVKEKKKTKKETKKEATVVEDASNDSDLELTDDLFSLIDSMYDERDDD